MNQGRVMPSHVKFPIANKFAVVLVVLAGALFAVGFAGLRGLSDLNNQVKGLYGDHIVTLQRTASLANDSDRALALALGIIASNDEGDIDHQERELVTSVVPQVNQDIATLRGLHSGDPAAERAEIMHVERSWARFVALLARGPLDRATSVSSAHDAALAVEVRSIFAPIEMVTRHQTQLEIAQSAALAKQARATYGDSQTLVLVIGSIALLVGAAVVALLIRLVVPRIRRYSRFASCVAAGEADTVVLVSGNDELSELGLALNEMVKRRAEERSREGAQSEFAEVMQLTENEEEAHYLLKRQVERVIPGSSVVTLNRNNSADRLQATTPVAEDSELAIRLENAKPRSCLAVRFARTHAEELDSDMLIACEVCGKTADFSTCEPLLVGGEVIGSVLATHPQPISDAEAETFRQSVTQAAPVLGNLRNLAIAERRAQTDSLTGLPNNRNVADTVKRMAAHASRTVAPLAALALDLDHFKHINDTHGHGSGDEVLAAVGSTLLSTCRDSDFVGRAGGEEFLILLPDTGLVSAEVVAEKVRLAVGAITIPSIQQAITTSIGVAILPDHAGDANTLLRHADRALYIAKKNGRNRVEVFTRDMLPANVTAGRSDDRPAGPAQNGRRGAKTASRRVPAKRG
jgi:diguanylate cyclase (GGDEF)-like protein